MNLHCNDFELFGLAPQFALQRSDLDARWKDLQRQVHPDRFASQGAAAQRVAMQWSVRINEAYQRLKDPVRRAAYLCELQGASIHAENNTAMPTDFLLQQMQWREELEEARGRDALEALQAQVAEVERDMLQKCAHWLDAEHQYAQAAQQVRALMFIERFASDVQTRLDQLDNQAQGD